MKRSIKIRLHKALPVMAALAAVHAPAVLSPALAADYAYPAKTFDAMYDMGEPAAKRSMRVLSDGQGKLVTVAIFGNASYRTVFDYKEKTITTITDDAKIAAQRVMKRAPEMGYTTESIKADLKSETKPDGLVDAGTKEVAGHQCRGYKAESKVGTSTVWIGDDIDCVVQTEIIAKEPPMTMRITLKDYKSSGPSDELLKIPAEYKLIKE